MLKVLFSAVLIFLYSASNAQVWLEQTIIDTQVVATNLEIPWEMETWSDDTILFTERGGKIRRLSLISGAVDELYTNTATIASEGQAGLLGMQIHPDFPNTPYVYIAEANYIGPSIGLFVKRLRYDSALDSLINDSVIVDNINVANSNLGGRMLIASDGLLYLSVGDLKQNDKPQSLESLNGKMLRYTLTGTIPESNPFPSSPIFSFGHRNPQGIAEDNDGNIWISEHGPSSDDELNILKSGRNYGWPLVTGFCNSSTQGVCYSLNMVEPHAAWSPTIAPAGVVYYSGNSIPEWENSMLITSLKEQRIIVAHFNPDKSAVSYYDWVFQYQFGRIRDILQMPNDRLFVCTSNRDVLGDPVAQDDIIMELIPSQHNGVSNTKSDAITYQIIENNVLLSQQVNGTAQLYSIDGRLLQTFDLNNTNRIALPHQTSFAPQLLRIQTEEALLTIKRYEH
jgi:glucose/arabinose dehydrogenase